ncbi:hypothetical protein [Mycolicibacterium vaccae]|uniref:hypothetical protein n=1 Tax=Mycolicibacterium vaccae TaxID=1810 RepID=UPI003D016ABE
MTTNPKRTGRVADGQRAADAHHDWPPDGDPTPIPLLVGDVDLTAGTAPSGPSADGYGGGHSAGATVSAAIRDVLGYRTRVSDAKGFQTALQRSFTCSEKTGYTVCTWTPRSYAATIPADLGALTGAQASIYDRAKHTADVILPLLDALTPLGSTADREDTAAIRSIIRSRITEVVEELGLEGGPRTQRVDELLERLTGLKVARAVGGQTPMIGGELDILRRRFAMDRVNVNTLAEEENFTNFLIIQDNIVMLIIAWALARDYFTHDIPAGGKHEPFLGTQLVLLSRQLNVVSETVNECYFAMDSVFLGAAERQTVLLKLRNEDKQTTSIFLSELLDWITRFSTDEGPHLIEEAGTDGVNAFVPTMKRLVALAESAVSPEAGSEVPPNYFTKRVVLALEQLASQLRRAEAIAAAVIDRLELDDASSSNSTRGGRR